MTSSRKASQALVPVCVSSLGLRLLCFPIKPVSRCPAIALSFAHLSVFIKTHFVVDDRKLGPTLYKRGCIGSSNINLASGMSLCRKSENVSRLSLPLSISLLCFLLANMAPGGSRPPCHRLHCSVEREHFFPMAKAKLDVFSHVTTSQLVTEQSNGML